MGPYRGIFRDSLLLDHSSRTLDSPCLSHLTFYSLPVRWVPKRPSKGELARRWPDFHVAFSRSGFLTFKLPEGPYLPPDFDLESVFARAYGFSLGKVTGADEGTLAQEVWNLFGDRPFQRIHVWQRDRAEPGHRGFEPSITSEAVAAYEAIRQACPRPQHLAGGTIWPRRHGWAIGSWIACWSIGGNGGSVFIVPDRCHRGGLAA